MASSRTAVAVQPRAHHDHVARHAVVATPSVVGAAQTPPAPRVYGADIFAIHDPKLLREVASYREPSAAGYFKECGVAGVVGLAVASTMAVGAFIYYAITHPSAISREYSSPSAEPGW